MVDDDAQPGTAPGAAEGESAQADAPPQTQEDAVKLAELRGRGKGEYGCKHYRRRVRFLTPCW